MQSCKRSLLADYLEICKPRVVALMLLTVIVGMLLAAPGTIPLSTFVAALFGIGCCAGSAAAINHLVDKKIDAIMIRTRMRPLVWGRILPRQVIIFAVVLASTGLLVLGFCVNPLTAWLTFISVIGYAGVYTGFLKRVTPQNIVIGGLAGAAPPLLGWTAVTNELDPRALVLVLIIFTWTPPHFWALAIHRYEDYKKALVPMLPVTHGIDYTRLQIVLYSILMFAASLMPWIIGMSGIIYLAGAVLLGVRFLQLAISLWRASDVSFAMPLFKYSIVYLLLLFVFLLLDHYLLGAG